LDLFAPELGLTALDGGELPLETFRDSTVLVVNVASRCGLTPQYEGLERLQKRFAGRRFSVLGVPCNQFAGQEPGSAGGIAEFCSATYGTTFPLTAKTDVNGAVRHPLFERLCAVPDREGVAGEVGWNFEKFVVAPGVGCVARFRPPVEPEADELISCIEAVLDGEAERWVPRPVRGVRVGDRVRTESGTELTVSRIDASFFGRPDMLALVEDGPRRWLKLPLQKDDDIEVLNAGRLLYESLDGSGS
jgi:glutathione peroxidase